jgi:hypothetical protein
VLCHRNGGDLEQIKFLLGHASIETTEHYLGSEQEIAAVVNDNLGAVDREQGPALILLSRGLDNNSQVEAGPGKRLTTVCHWHIVFLCKRWSKRRST